MARATLEIPQRRKKAPPVEEVVQEVKRGRGRPPKVVEAVETPKSSRNGVKPVASTKTKPVAVAPSTPAKQGTASASIMRLPKIIDVLTALVDRATIGEFRGKKAKPELLVTKTEMDALRAAVVGMQNVQKTMDSAKKAKSK